MPNVKCILTEQGGKGGGSAAVVPTRLVVTTQPTKTTYRVGDNFEIAGLKATVSYGAPGSALSMGTANIPEDISYSSLIVTPSTNLQETNDKVTISYIENDVTVSADVSITVKNSNLTITGPTTKSYAWGAQFKTAGLVIKDADGTTISNYTLKIGSVVIANDTVLNNAAFTIGTNTVDVTATGSDGAALMGDFTITITKASVTIPSQNGSLTYNGGLQSPVWNNKVDALMDLTIEKKTIAGGPYDAKFNLKDKIHYQWNDGTTNEQNIPWYILKANLSDSQVTVSGNTAIDASNLSRTVTVTIPTGEVGTIDISPSTVSGLTITKGTQTANARTFTFKGNGSTALTQAFTVTVNGCTNYNNYSKSSKFTITAQYWSWGADGGTADAAWFTGLKNYLASNSGSSLKTSAGGNILGTTKSVTLSSSVLGTTTHLIRVIGVDQDAPNTVTFQTKNCLNEYTTWSTTAYSSSNKTAAMWTDSACKAKTECVNYYNAFPGKTAIKEISKGTCPSTNDSRNGTVTYNNEKVFLLSEREFGLDSYSPLSTANSTTSNAECTQGKNFSYAFYTSNETRIMGKGDGSSSKNDGYPWERSRYYNSSSSNPTIVCCVGTDGTASNVYYSGSCGLAPAFVIGN